MRFSWLQNLVNRRPRPSKNRRRVHTAQAEVFEQRTVLTMLSPVSVATGSTPSMVEVRDFNGDGINDIASLNSSVSAISVQLGNGDGTFQAGVNSAAGGFGTKMVVSDFNHDGKLDIVTCQGGSIDLLRGNGDGSFQLPQAYYVGAFANDVEVGDFNNDGLDDIATASFSYGGTTQVFINDGVGSFLPSRNVAIGPGGLDVEAGDLDGDGNVDLVESSGSGYIEVLMGRGDGTFASNGYTYGVPTQDIRVSDLNQDGNSDVIVAYNGTVKVFTGNGATTFQPAPTTYQTGAGANRIELGDINGDGNQDIVSNNGVAILGRGNSGFYAPTVYGVASGAAIGLGDLNGDGGIDAVAGAPTGIGSGVNVTLNANNDVQLLAGATQLLVSSSGSATAGSPFAVTVTALDANGNIVAGFQGTVSISGAPGTQPTSYTFSAADGGVHTIANAATLFAAGSGTFTVTSPFLPDATGMIDVVAGAAAKFSVVGEVTAMAGNASSVTVSAFDAYGNPVSNLGTVHFSSSDAQASLPSDYTFTSADAGSHAFAVTLRTAGAQTISASDITTSTIAGTSSSVNVTPAATASLSLTGGGGYIGSVNAVQITARDAFGNLATGYNGIVHLASSDPASVTSVDAALANGVGTFTVTPMTLGSQTLSASDATDATIGGSEVIDITPGWGARFVATPLSATVAGQTQSTTLTVYDDFGNVSTVYTGWVAVRTTDPLAPLSYVYFTAADAGVKTIPVTLYTSGSQAVTISDYYNPGVAVTQTGISVTPGAAASISITALTGTTAGVAQNFTATARDAYGNVAPSYLGTLNFTSSDTLAALPANYTFSAADAGTHTFSVTFKSSGGQSITVSDPANSLAMNSFQRDIMITPAALSTFGFKGASLSNTTAGAVFNLTISATDAYGNAITGYTGTAILSSTDAQGTLPSSYTFTAADAGAHTFSVALKTAGTQSITATDSANGAVTGSVSSIVVKAAAASKFSIATPTTATSGVAQTVTVTATDAYGNFATGYTGTMKFSSSDAQAILPANYSYTNKDAGVHGFSVTLKTVGSQSITVADNVNSALTASQSGITVSASTAQVASFSVTGFPATTAGTTKTFMVTARDAQGNVVSGYTGTVTFSSSDVKAGLPASYTFTAADVGVHTFSATLKTSGTQSITVTDTASNSVVGSQTGISITAGAATQFVISIPTSVTQGVGFKFTLTVYDACGNVATGYLGKVHLSSTDSKGGTSDYTFSKSDNGVHIFSYTFNTLGSQALTIADTTNSALTARANVNVLSK